VAEGFGLQSYYTNQVFDAGGVNGGLATLVAASNYAGTGNNVGIVATSYNDVILPMVRSMPVVPLYI